MKDIFVSFEIMEKLKEIGFNEPCFLNFYKIWLAGGFKLKENE